MVTSHWNTFFWGCKLVLHIDINTITFSNINIGSHMCHIYWTLFALRSLTRAADILLEMYCTYCHFVENEQPLYTWPGPINPRIHQFSLLFMLAFLYMSTLCSRSIKYQGTRLLNVASSQCAPLRTDLCVVLCRSVWLVQPVDVTVICKQPLWIGQNILGGAFCNLMAVTFT